jgi:type III pantothenate kinase
MPDAPDPTPTDADATRIDLIAISVGNSRTTVGRFVGLEPRESRSLANDRLDELGAYIATLAGAPVETERSAIVLASVNKAHADRVADRIEAGSDRQLYVLGDDLQIPIRGRLDPSAQTGQDRLLAALAAHDVMEQACVVVDAGTAITVDFVDGEGVFQGGAIAPGLRMGLAALHTGAEALPEVELAPPDADETFGRNTRQAMLIGVIEGARGLVRTLVERYAEAYGAYPPVVATGGDAELLFAADPLIDRVVPDLALRGVAVACARALDPDAED